MRLPQFTAEASLSKTRKPYLSRQAQAQSGSGSGVIPQDLKFFGGDAILMILCDDAGCRSIQIGDREN
jgi:hypothetical protein